MAHGGNNAKKGLKSVGSTIVASTTLNAGMIIADCWDSHPVEAGKKAKAEDYQNMRLCFPWKTPTPLAPVAARFPLN